MWSPKWSFVGYVLHPPALLAGMVVASVGAARHYGALAGGTPPFWSFEFLELAWNVIPAALAVPALWYYAYHRRHDVRATIWAACAAAFTILFFLPVILNVFSHGLRALGRPDEAALVFRHRYALFWTLGWPAKAFLALFVLWLPTHAWKRARARWASLFRPRSSL